MLKISIESVVEGQSRLIATALIDEAAVVLSKRGRPAVPWITGKIKQPMDRRMGPWEKLHLALDAALDKV